MGGKFTNVWVNTSYDHEWFRVAFSYKTNDTTNCITKRVLINFCRQECRNRKTSQVKLVVTIMNKSDKITREKTIW